MQQISISVPNAQLGFMLELLQKLDFVKIDTATKPLQLTKEQIQLVEKERKLVAENKNYPLDWENVKNKFNV
jgi:hypothetical protein